jgi:hypothetical protein
MGGRTLKGDLARLKEDQRPASNAVTPAASAPV